MIILGAVAVLVAKPHPPANTQGPELFWVAVFVAMTALSWGAYGPVLHKGQQAMLGSRLRPFICVGAAYFIIAVLAPLLLLPTMARLGEFSFWAVLWSFVGGVMGAVGALGIIMAFTAGGKPIYVMPLVFGGAPVVNALTEIIGRHETVGALFLAGLILVIAGAVMVLVFAPRAEAHPPPLPT
jgi:drug/metabolite transporter (DMT)-like permease